MTNNSPENFASTATTSIVARADLHAALDMAKLVVEARNTVPILDCAQLTGSTAGLTVTATDLDTSISVVVPGAADVGSITFLPVRKVHDILAKNKDLETVAIDTIGATDSTDEMVKLDLEAVDFTLNSGGFEVADFPVLTGTRDNHIATIPTEELARIFGKISHAISQEETRYYLNGIYMHVFDGHLCYVATDGRRLVRYEGNTNVNEGSVFGGMIIPKKAIAVMMKIMKRKDCPASVKVEVGGESSIAFTLGHIRLETKVIDGTFPDYHRIMPQPNGEHKIACNSALFAKVLDRVTSITAKGAAIKLTLGGDRVTCTTQTEGNSASAEFVAETTDDEFEFGMNSHHLAEALKIMGETTKIETHNAGDPMLITGDDDNMKMVLMPMRT